MPKRNLVFMNIRHKVIVSIIGMLVLSSCSGGRFLAGAGGVADFGCVLHGTDHLDGLGRAIIQADHDELNSDARVKVIRWEDKSERWSTPANIYPLIDPDPPYSYSVSDKFLTTAYWFGLSGCENWYSAQELLSPLVKDVGTSGHDPNDDSSNSGDPIDGSIDTTDPGCLDSPSSDAAECPASSEDGGSGGYGD